MEIMTFNSIDLGIKAMEDIPALTLICEYACDILPLTCAQRLTFKYHIMFYANGKNSEEELLCEHWHRFVNRIGLNLL